MVAFIGWWTGAALFGMVHGSPRPSINALWEGIAILLAFLLLRQLIAPDREGGERMGTGSEHLAASAESQTRGEVPVPHYFTTRRAGISGAGRGDDRRGRDAGDSGALSVFRHAAGRSPAVHRKSGRGVSRGGDRHAGARFAGVSPRRRSVQQPGAICDVQPDEFVGRLFGSVAGRHARDRARRLASFASGAAGIAAKVGHRRMRAVDRAGLSANAQPQRVDRNGDRRRVPRDLADSGEAARECFRAKPREGGQRVFHQRGRLSAFPGRQAAGHRVANRGPPRRRRNRRSPSFARSGDPLLPCSFGLLESDPRDDCRPSLVRLRARKL